jgi:3-hydroxybutyrate dehydrogenase
MPQPRTRSSPATRRVFVTGGTGTLGEAIVTAFAKAGYTTSFQYRANQTVAERLTSEFGASAYRMDLSDQFEPPSADIDILINCAGINESEEVTHLVDPGSWAKMLHVNLTVPFLLVRAVVPGMVQRGWGRIVNIGSIYSVRAAPNRAPYVASKHGLSGLTKAIAKEYATFGVTCNEICPSAVESQMIERIARDRAKRQGRTAEDVLSDYREASPAKRMATADEVASAALFLASPAASFINGASLQLDGGLVA